MRLLRRTLPLLAVAGLCACPPTGVDEGAFNRAMLRDHLEAWTAAAPRAYEYVIVGACECLPQWTAPAKAQVLDRQTTSFRYLETGQPVDWPRFLELSTVEELFAFVDDAYRRNAEVVHVEYDHEWGFPREVHVDYDRQVGDDEFRFTVREFARLPEPLGAE